MGLVWSTSPYLTLALGVITLLAGILPAAAAYIGQLIVDGVVLAISENTAGNRERIILLVVAEGTIVTLIAASQTGITLIQSLMRALLGQRVNRIILEKALSLELSHFEDSEIYDKLTRARREASSRPLSLVKRSFGLIQNAISLTSFAVLLWQFSPWVVLLLMFGGLPAFFSEAKFSGDAFRLFRWRSTDTRKQMYLESVMAREDYVKEVKLFGLGELLLNRYTQIFNKLFKEDKKLTIRRGVSGFILGIIGTASFYAAYLWIALEAIATLITIGQMTMYLILFKQGQSSFSSMLTAINGMYEDNLYLSNLYEFLEHPSLLPFGTETDGPDAQAGIEFSNVGFTYQGANQAALEGIDVQIKKGQSLAIVGTNGSGKSTLIKLLCRFYTPGSGHIKFKGIDIADWDEQALRQKISVIFQDFAHYQFRLGENIGIGDVAHFNDKDRWSRAAELGRANFVDQLPNGFETQLGRWFENGQELSGGQWQRVALARAFMREEAEILVLDEPTATLDAEAELEIFSHFKKIAKDKITILISHRFSSVRMADAIMMLDNGKIIEYGTHSELMALNGRYAKLFAIQAAAYL